MHDISRLCLVRRLIWSLMMLTLPLAARSGEPSLERGFAHPPQWAKPRVYWFWIYNRVDSEGVVRDLREFAAKGIGGVNLICNGGYAGKEPLFGIDFLGPE